MLGLDAAGKTSMPSNHVQKEEEPHADIITSNTLQAQA